MMKKIFLSIFVFVLSACATPQPRATPTADVTFTPQPTASPTATPVPSFPEGTDSKFVSWQDGNGQWWGGAQAGDKQLSLNSTGEWESTVKLPPAIVDAVSAKFGEGYTVFGDKIIAPDGKAIPKIHIEAGEGDSYTTWMDEYVAIINGVEVTIPRHKVELTKDENGKLCQPAFCLETGQWVREIVTFPALEGGEVKLEVFSNEEVNAEISATAKDMTPEDREISENYVETILDELLGRQYFGSSNPSYTFNGMLMPGYKRYLFIDNELIVNDGKADEEILVETSTYVVRAIGNNAEYALVGWRAGGIEYSRIVDKSKLNIPANFNPLFEQRQPKY